MTAYFNKTRWPAKAPESEKERKEFIASLHKRKTELFMALIEKKLLPLRPGVAKSGYLSDLLLIFAPLALIVVFGYALIFFLYWKSKFDTYK
jgi:hypothetical protein